MAFGPKPKPLADRFWAKVDKRGPDECWSWLGACDHHGYGQISYGGGHKHIKAHRASWLIHHGVLLAPEVKLRHKVCDNPPCVNPAHLEPGTQADNHDDMKAKGRGNIGMRHGHAKLTDEQVIAIRCDERPLEVIAQARGVNQSVVSAIQLGKAWPHLGGPIRGYRKRGPKAAAL